MVEVQEEELKQEVGMFEAFILVMDCPIEEVEADMAVKEG